MNASRNGSMVLVLGMLAATGPMAIDMYLPSIPAMAGALNAGEGAVQLTLMTFFVGLMLGQLAYGPLSDKYGRKPLAYLGLTIFTLGSVACALATDISQLLWLRFLQGIGGSIGMVIAFAVIKDHFSGPDVGKMMSLVLAVLGITPVLAPLGGDLLQNIGSWRSIFWFMVAFGIVLMAMVATLLPETRKPAERQSFVLGQTFQNYGRIFIDRRFIPFTLALCTAQAGFFAYLAGSASVFISEHGLSPTQFSLIFGVNAIGLMAAALLNPTLHRRMGPMGTFRYLGILYFAVLALLLVYLLLGGASIIVWSAGLFVAVASLGFLMPTGSQLALMQQGQYAGTASALMGSMQFGFGALISGASGALAHFGGLGLTTIMAACALISMLICLFWFPKKLDASA
ncbi:multidrug effflux MFS transporter [Pusillimonas sp.]|uniref:multidrug effflux MFS transporter n=1 Tax=Pusillimonas sp. TaxID=3040095 RepID=UPI0037C996C2